MTNERPVGCFLVVFLHYLKEALMQFITLMEKDVSAPCKVKAVC